MICAVLGWMRLRAILRASFTASSCLLMTVFMRFSGDVHLAGFLMRFTAGFTGVFVRAVSPHLAVITTIVACVHFQRDAPDHIDYFQGLT